MASTVTAPEMTNEIPLMRRPRVAKLLVIALLAEIGYAVLNISAMPIYLKGDRHFGATALGFVLVAFLLCEAVFKSPMGHMADRFGPKKLMLIGPMISVVTSLVSFAIPTTDGKPLEILAFVCLRACDGLGAAMLWPAAFSAVGEAVDDDERQQAMSLLNLCYMLGIAFAFPLEGIVNDVTHTKWAGLLLATGLFSCVALAVWRFVDPIEPSKVQKEQAGQSEFVVFLQSVRKIPSYLILAIVTFIGVGFPMAIFKLFPYDQFHFSETMVGLLIGPGAIVMGIASVPISKFGEKIGRARAVHIGLGACSAGLWLIALGAIVPPMRSPLIFAAGGIPVGIGFLLAIPAWMASVSDIDPNCRGANLGAIMTAQGIGAIIGTPIGSTMYEKLQPIGEHLRLGHSFGRYSPFLGCAVCLTIGFILSTRILRVEK
ncbi:MAG: MFS transporter [Fimbriimonas sp.]|nr:MFS transporter [Fimbriimonas sp.]